MAAICRNSETPKTSLEDSNAFGSPNAQAIEQMVTSEPTPVTPSHNRALAYVIVKSQAGGK
jgi:hypothetical protein